MAEERLHTVGRRKSAVARVWIKPGNGTITVNRKPIEEYVKRETDRILIRQPLTITDSLEKFDISVTVRGGGISGQAGAVRHGISKALVSADPELRPPLRRGGYLTRDPRVKERKKYGRKRARRGFQFSKR